MTTAVPVRPGHLRDAAEKIEHDTGLNWAYFHADVTRPPAEGARSAGLPTRSGQPACLTATRR
ncbi:MAG: hypothetical protein JWN00_5516 [Actinomycetia bacterium]|nr:hypothetical protein [Actinomycetes bacterium]